MVSIIFTRTTALFLHLSLQRYSCYVFLLKIYLCYKICSNMGFSPYTTWYHLWLYLFNHLSSMLTVLKVLAGSIVKLCGSPVIPGFFVIIVLFLSAILLVG